MRLINLFLFFILFFAADIVYAASAPAVPSPLFLLRLQGDLSDASGHGKNGTAIGTKVWFVSDAGRGQVLSLNSSGWVEVNASLPANFTKTAWVKLRAPTAGSYNIIGNYSNGSGNIFWISNLTQNGAPSNMSLRSATYKGRILHYGWDRETFPTNTWAHVALTYDGSTYRLYKNGVRVSTAAASVAPGLVSAPTRIGTFAGQGGNWIGYLSDVAMWDSALTDGQIAAIYAGETGVGRPAEYLHILSTGQSLSLGVQATPALSTTQPYNNLMMTNGLDQIAAPLVPLTEIGSAEEWLNAESPSAGMANTLRAFDASERPIIVSLHGHGSTNYNGLKKGTVYYDKGITQARSARDYVQNTLGGVYRPIAVTAVHGEADYLEGNAPAYEGYLRQWQSDYQNDLNALTRGSSIIPLFINQLNSAWTGELAVAQLNAHRNNPGKIILVGPKYQMEYSGTVHLKNIYSKYMGELMGKVIKKVVLDGQVWSPLMPTSIIRTGNIITISYRIPAGTLAIDTFHVAQRINYGFEFAQTGGNAVSITSVQLISNNTQVKLILSDIPTGTNQHVKYAWGCPNMRTWCGGAKIASYAGGNIRDTDTSVSQAINSTGLPLYDWSVAFNEPVIAAEVVAGDSASSGGNLTSQTIAIAPQSRSAQFMATLRNGMSGAEVKHLQEIFASDPSIYPEALVTGYFSTLTQKAVERFQIKYNIVAAGSPDTTGFGLVGPRTRAKLNEIAQGANL